MGIMLPRLDADMNSKRTSTVAAGATIIFVGTLVSRLLGLIRERLLVNTFPDRLTTDAFLSAFLVPDTLYYLLAGGALSAAFIPVFSSYLSKGEREDANKTAYSIANLMTLAIIGGLVLIFIFAPEIVRVVAHGYLPGSHKYNLTVVLAREMCAMVVFTALSGLMTGMLQSVHHFFTPVIVWNTYSIGIIVGIKFFSKLPTPSFAPSFLHWNGPTLGIHGAALGVLLGAFSLAAIQLPVVIKHGFRYAPRIHFHHEGVQRVLVLFAPVMVGLALGQINLLAIPQMMGSALPDGAVTDIRNATRLVLLPLGLFGMALSTAAFPRLAQQAARGETQGFRELFGKSTKFISLLVIPCSIGMFVLAEPIVSLLYGGKGFGITDIHATAFALSFFCWGILSVSLVQFVSRAFYSLQDTITPVVVQVVFIAVNVGLALSLIKFTTLSYGGVSLASSITSTASTLVLFELLRRRLKGIQGHAILRAVLKVTLASVIMGVVLFVVAKVLAPVAMTAGTAVRLEPVLPFRWPTPDLTHRVASGITNSPGHIGFSLGLAIQISITMGVGMFAYFAALWVLKVEELKDLISRFTSKIRKRSAAV